MDQKRSEHFAKESVSSNTQRIIRANIQRGEETDKLNLTVENLIEIMGMKLKFHNI